MCQAKSKGGKRCFIHMMGTQASVMMAAVMGNVPEKHANEVAKELRKEGKGLPTPSEEEIVAFARNNQFISRHDVTIPEKMRPGLVKRWQKAEMERPDGGGFHAWKHVLVESVVRYRRTAAAVGLAGLMTFSTACSGGSDVGQPSSDSVSSPSPSISQMAPAGPSITGGDVVKTDKGEYLQSTISDDDPAMKFDPSKIQADSVGVVPAENFESAQRYAVTYIAEEGIDSSLNNSATSVDAWWAENESRFDPAYRADFKQRLDEGKGPVIQNKWQKELADNYNYVYSSNETRLSERQINVKNMYYSADANVYVVQTEFSYTAKVDTPDGIKPEVVKGTYDIGVIPADNGKDWMITYYNSQYDVHDAPIEKPAQNQ